MEVVVVKIGSTWGYVITKYGYPPSVPDIIKGLRETKALGFDSMEIEGAWILRVLCRRCPHGS